MGNKVKLYSGVSMMPLLLRILNCKVVFCSPYNLVLLGPRHCPCFPGAPCLEKPAPPPLPATKAVADGSTGCWEEQGREGLLAHQGRRTQRPRQRGSTRRRRSAAPLGGPCAVSNGGDLGGEGVWVGRAGGAPGGCWMTRGSLEPLRVLNKSARRQPTCHFTRTTLAAVRRSPGVPRVG